uniref:ADP-ribosylation factor-like protein 13B n=1 Tax=Clastoptera arizonana TaxID=38151 RepID=A0A1B6DYH3_9HEMI
MDLCKCLTLCCSPFGFFRKYSSIRRRKIVLLLVGLDNSGKSATVNNLVKEPINDMIPTVGFNVVRLKHRGYPVTIYDLGGGPQIRHIWSHYYVDAYGVIYVIDASDQSRIEENKNALKDILEHDKMAGKPILILANKQDQDGALDELDIVEKLQVESLVNQQRCPTLVETCSAVSSNVNKKKLDPGIHSGYRWLLHHIIKNYDSLNKRVNNDTNENNIKFEEDFKAWKEKKIKERENLQIESSFDDDDEENQEYPFKPINTVMKHLEDNHVHTITMNGYTPRTENVESSENFSDNNSPDSKSQEIISKQLHQSALSVVKEQFAWKEANQRKKRRKLKNNRTAPIDVLINKKITILPPIKQSTLCYWDRPTSSKGRFLF